MSTPTIRAALERLLAVCDTDESNVLDIDPDLLLDAIVFACAALASEPVGEGPSDEAPEKEAPIWYNSDMASSWQAGRQDGWNDACSRWGRPAAPPDPEAPAEALAARPLLEQVARLGDCIGANTVGQIMAISSRAADWLKQNPPGQPVAIEPRGCPTPGACSCVEPTPAAPEVGEVGELVDRLGWIAAQLGDIGWSDDSASVARAATLLSQLSAPAPPAPEVGEVAELVARLRDWHSIPLLRELERIATLLLQFSAPARERTDG